MIRSVCSVLLLIYPFGLGAASRLDRLNLLQYRGDSGKVEAVKTPADWQKRRSEILREWNRLWVAFLVRIAG